MSKPMVRVHRPDGIVGVEKAIALRAAESYCADHRLSVSKLSRLVFDIYDDVAMFMAKSDIKPDGLKNDIATQPLPVLILEGSGNALVIRQTEHTSKYLATET